MSKKQRKQKWDSTREELLLRALKDLGDNELKEFKWYLQKSDVLERFPIIPKSQLDKADRPDTVDQMLQTYCENTLEVTKKVLRKLDRNDLVQILTDPNAEPVIEGFAEYQKILKSNLMKRFQESDEKFKKGGKSKVQNETYTEVYLKFDSSKEISKEHEIRLIETACQKLDRPEATIRYEDIFKSLPGRDGPIRRVLTKGVAGIGKTVLTQKFTLDWAEDKANKDIHFIFPFTFRELNVLKEEKFSLVELVNHFFTETKEAGIKSLEEFKVVFIFDGLDECRLPLDFHNSKTVTAATESTSVDVLLANLIRGNLLPSARLWITTRPAAANQIPPDYINIVTEVTGFSDAQKLDYFRKKCRDEKLISRMIPHIKTSRSLHIMCHIPVFCWITATVLEDLMKTKNGGELPKTLTEMYIHLLVSQANVKNTKPQGGADANPQWNQASKEMMLTLGKLAFEQLQKGNLIFYESDLKECSIKTTAASVYSGLFTELFKEERVLNQHKVFSFIHLSVQEFLAALYVHLTFTNSGLNLLEESQQNSWMSKLSRRKTNLYQTAVDKTLQSPNGHLDMFLRFLLGLSLQTNQNLLQGLLTQTGSHQETVQYIKERLDEGLSPEKSINLFHCLNEMNNHSLVEEMQQSLSSGSLCTDDLSPAQWSALVFILLTSEDLDVFDLKKYSPSDIVLQRLLPVVKASRKALLSFCNLSEKSLTVLSPVLSSQASSLRELDLSNNNLQDSGVKLLSTILEGSQCPLETLRLRGCELSWRSCETLSVVISTQSLSLKELDVSNNDLQDSGVQLLSAGLEGQHCVLEILRLSGCQVTEQGCAALASALASNPSHLRELDLSYNHPGEQGVAMLSGGVEDRQCTLETLRVEHCGEQRLKRGLKKYACELELDPNTAHRNLKLSEDYKKVTVVQEEQPYPSHPERFDHCCWQVLCKNGVTGRCYWEVEREGQVVIAVSYKRIGRKGNSADCRLGWNDQCWSLICTKDHYSFWHNKRETVVYVPYGTPMPKRVAVYVDSPGGTLSFYRVASDTLTHLHTFHTTFTEPVYPAFGFGFGFWSYDSAVSLCED